MVFVKSLRGSRPKAKAMGSDDRRPLSIGNAEPPLQPGESVLVNTSERHADCWLTYGVRSPNREELFAVGDFSG